eukprot:1104047-Rhodomonas_salina.1
MPFGEFLFSVNFYGFDVSHVTNKLFTIRQHKLPGLEVERLGSSGTSCIDGLRAIAQCITSGQNCIAGVVVSLSATSFVRVCGTSTGSDLVDTRRRR